MTHMDLTKLPQPQPSIKEVGPLLPPVVRKARFGVRDMTYYHPADGGDTLTVESLYGRWCDGDDQPYIRHLKVGPVWKSVETGWLTSVGLLILKNEGKELPHHLSEEERVVRDDHTLDVGLLMNPVEDPKQRTMLSEPPQEPILFLRILPGEVLRCSPSEVGRWVMRSNQPTKVVITLLPA